VDWGNEMSALENSQKSLPGDLSMPGLVPSAVRVEQLSFSDHPMTPFPTGVTFSPEVEQSSFPGNPKTPFPESVTRQLGSPDSLDLATIDTARQPSANTTYTGSPLSTDVALLETQQVETPNDSQIPPSRPPVVIRGDYRQKPRSSLRPPQGRRSVIGIAALVLLLVITGGTLFAASPLGRDINIGFNSFASGGTLVKSDSSNNLDLVQQATATAVVHQHNDGYDPNAGGGGPVVTGSPENWPLGVCTYWANYRYHELTGYWVTWLGNAYQWAEGARLAGWHVSSQPHVPSIIVLQPGVQGASSYGHVAVVESASGDTVHTSNMNWYANGGGWDIVSYYDFTVGPGVSFIWV
jgi:surface antigen